MTIIEYAEKLGYKLNSAQMMLLNKMQEAKEHVVLLHLSDDNSDAELFAARAKEVVGMADVYVSDRGMEIELNKEPF